MTQTESGKIKMNNTFKRITIGVLVASLSVLAGCGGGSGTGSGTNETASTGFLSLAVSDGPIHEAKKVCITFEEIELKSGSNTSVITLGAPQTVNLLDFQGDDSTLILANAEVEAGDYQWMRLGINAVMGGDGGSNDLGDDTCADGASYMVMKDESLHNLFVPSSAQNGLKLVGGFTVPVSGSANFTAEWDLMKSITAPAGLAPDVIMKPVIRLVNNAEVGTLMGVVATDLATALNEDESACEPSVYVFDDGVTPNPDGIDGEPENTETDPNDAVARAMVNEQTNDDGSVEWNYTVGFLLAGSAGSAGEYEAAFTCDGTNFEPVDGKQATISAGETSTVNFDSPPQ